MWQADKSNFPAVEGVLFYLCTVEDTLLGLFKFCFCAVAGVGRLYVVLQCLQPTAPLFSRFLTDLGVNAWGGTSRQRTMSCLTLRSSRRPPSSALCGDVCSLAVPGGRARCVSDAFNSNTHERGVATHAVFTNVSCQCTSGHVLYVHQNSVCRSFFVLHGGPERLDGQDSRRPPTTVLHTPRPPPSWPPRRLPHEPPQPSRGRRPGRHHRGEGGVFE